MKNKYRYIGVIALMVFSSSCNTLDVPPVDVIQDNDIFNSKGGVTAYMASLYERLPIEDFRYSADQTESQGFDHWNLNKTLSLNTGEQISRRHSGIINPALGYWDAAYTAIRYINYFMATLPQKSTELRADEIEQYLGEAYFLRAYIYFALVKRYGGVPIINAVQSFPEQSLSELQVPRNTEPEVYDFIAADLDAAISKLPENSVMRGRANKYIAAAFKSRAMIFAGSIAKYGQMNDATPAVGIPASRANEYFKLSYDAAKMLEGKYSLYRKNPDKYQNYVDLFLDKSSGENIFVKDYVFPETGHGYDCLFVPNQMVGPQGYGSSMCPTLDYVEMFDGLPRDANGFIQTKDANDICIYYDSPLDIFKDAEPRLRATVILPGDEFKGEIIDIRRGIYVGPITDGIQYTDNLSVNPFTNSSLCVLASSSTSNPLVDIGNGESMTAAGLSGMYSSRNVGTISGFTIRKYLDPNRPTALVRLANYSDQSWIDIRYAEILLNRAEAAYELYQGGYSGEGTDFLQDAFVCINDIRDRAGAILLSSASDLTHVDIIRKERRKELAFENKIWWDIRRWRTADTELNNRTMYILNGYYVKANGKYVFQRRTDERNARLTFNVNWYYEPIPSGEIGKNPSLLPNNPGY